MRYTYIAAWAMRSGIKLPDESESLELYNSGGRRFTLTRDPASLLMPIDRGAAIGTTVFTSISRQVANDPRAGAAAPGSLYKPTKAAIDAMILRGFSDQPAGELEAAVAAATDEIIAERERKRRVGWTVLVLEAQGDVEASVDEARSGDCGEFIVCFDAVDEEAVRQDHRADEDAMKLALALDTSPPGSFTALSSGVYLTTDEGKAIYSLSYRAYAEVVLVTRLREETLGRILARYQRLRHRGGLERVQRLFVQMSDVRTDRLDRLRPFLWGWAALEILIAKAFKLYEEEFLAPLTKADHPTLRERFLKRVRDVMKDKYRLADKFDVVSAVLFPNAPDSEVQDDGDKFRRLKGIRDSVYHGDDVSEWDLPVSELAELLRKYVLGYMEAANGARQRA